MRVTATAFASTALQAAVHVCAILDQQLQPLLSKKPALVQSLQPPLAEHAGSSTSLS